MQEGSDSSACAFLVVERLMMCKWSRHMFSFVIHFYLAKCSGPCMDNGFGFLLCNGGSSNEIA